MRKQKKNNGGSQEIVVEFAVEQEDATAVYLCGDFNQWSPSSLPMIRRGDCLWEKRVVLPPGRYQYKFLIDGKWTRDPYALREVPNVFGSTNSVAEVR